MKIAKRSRQTTTNANTDISRADYLDNLCDEIAKYIDEQGYNSVVSATDGYYIIIQLFDYSEEDFESEDSLHTAVFDIDEIDETEDISDIAEQLGQSVIDEYESEDFANDRYEETQTKQVVDSDGFMTDYTMYYDHEDNKYIFMLGDKDVYGPDESYADWECDSEQEAYEWFDSYDGFVDEASLADSDIESPLHSTKSSTQLDGRNINASEDYYEDPIIIAKEYFETGHGPDEFDAEYFKDEDAYEEYLQYINLGPRGFYEEYKDELDFDDFFVGEYGWND